MLCRRSVMHFSFHEQIICNQGELFDVFGGTLLTCHALLSASSHFEVMTQEVK